MTLEHDAHEHVYGGAVEQGMAELTFAHLDATLALCLIQRERVRRGRKADVAVERMSAIAGEAMDRIQGERASDADVAELRALDELVSASHDAILCLDATHPARVRLEAALADMGVATPFTVSGNGHVPPSAT